MGKSLGMQHSCVAKLLHAENVPLGKCDVSKMPKPTLLFAAHHYLYYIAAL